MTPNLRHNAPREQLDAPLTEEELKVAGEHFTKFTGEINEHMLEREDFIDQAAIALLAGKHLIAIGHPGTSKTTANQLFLKRIVNDDGQPSYFEIQFHGETRSAEFMGARMPYTNERGEMELRRQIERGMAPKDFANLDEFFDAPPTILRALLGALLERTIKDGNDTHHLALQSAFAATNKTLEQLKAKFGDELDALVDRFSALFWTTKRPLRPETDVKIVRAAAKRKMKKTGSGMTVPPLQMTELGTLKKAVEYVQKRMIEEQWPLDLAAKLYRAYHAKIDDIEEEEFSGQGRSKMESGRTMADMINLLPAIAVARYAKDPTTPLAVIPEDFDKLRLFVMMRGPQIGDIPADTDSIAEEQDRFVLNRLKTEDTKFTEAYREIVEPKARELQRTMPTNVPDLTAKLESYESAITRGTNSITETGLRNIMTVTTDLEAIRLRAQNGEALYARAVTVLLEGIHIAAATDQINLVHSGLPVAQAHADKLEGSFFNGGITKALRKVRDAVQGYYERKITSTGTIEEAMEDLTKIADEEPLLGAAVVHALRDRVKDEALKRIAAVQPQTEDDFRTACSDYENMQRLQETLEREGMAELVPLDRLIHLRTQQLEYVGNILDAAQKLLAAGATTRDDVLDLVNTILDIYNQTKNTPLTVTNARKLPQDVYDGYIAAQTHAKMAAYTGAKSVTGRIAQTNDNGTTEFTWSISTEASQTIDVDGVRTAYKEYRETTILENDERLIAIPEVRTQYDRLLKNFKLYLSDQWQDNFAVLLQEEFLLAVRSAVETGKNASVAYPVDREGLRSKGATLIGKSIQTAVKKYIDDNATDAGMTEAFMETQNMPVSPANTAAFTALMTDTTKKGQQTISLETVTEENETVKVEDIVATATAQEEQTWQTLDDEITTKTDALGTALAQEMVQAKIGALVTPSGPITTATFVEKWTPFFTGSTTGATTTTRWPNIPVNFAGDKTVETTLATDLKQMVDGFTPDETTNLETAVKTVLGPVHACLTAGHIQTGPLYQAIQTKLMTKIQGWMDGRIAYYKDAGNIASATTTEDQLSYLETATEIITAELSTGTNFTDTLTWLQNTLGLDSATLDDAKKQFVNKAAEEYATICEKTVQAMEGYEIPEIGFKAKDLTTITAANADAIVPKLKIVTERANKILEASTKLEQAQNGLIDAATTGKIGTMKTWLNTLTGNLRTKVAQERPSF